MKGHNFPADDISNGVWGPDWGPNCPAWRTLRTNKIDELNKNWIFQGYSGMIYCAKEMEKRGEGHDCSKMYPLCMYPYTPKKFCAAKFCE